MAKAKKHGKNEGQYDTLSLIPTPVLVINTDHDVRFVNKACQRMFAGKHPVGKKCYDLFRSDKGKPDHCP